MANAILIRIGADASYGRWNGPVDPDTREFVYVPIPEKPDTAFHPSCERPYAQLRGPLEDFARSRVCSRDTALPDHLADLSMHLDPDFERLTYGDVGNRRGAGLASMARGDLVVFYAGLRPIRTCEHRLIYALVGIMTINEIVKAASVPSDRFDDNAHTRKVKRGEHDIVVRATPEGSGRFKQCLIIGSFRERAYRATHDLLDAWGGLAVKNGYLQRSAVPPRFKDGPRFKRWLGGQDPELLRSNW